jgi:hypothetical protein
MVAIQISSALEMWKNGNNVKKVEGERHDNTAL